MQNHQDKIMAKARFRSRPGKLHLLKKPLSSIWNRYQLGAVIGPETISICLVRNYWRHQLVIETNKYEIEQGGITDWKARIEAAAQVIDDYLKMKRLPRIPINISLCSQEIGFRRLTLPVMPDQELESAIIWESKALFPFDITGSIVEYDIVDRFSEEGSERYSINVTAIRREILDFLYFKFGQSRLRIGQVNFLPVVLGNMTCCRSESPSDMRRLVLYLDQQSSYALFVHNDRLEFYQEFMTSPRGNSRENPQLENLTEIVEELASFLDLYHAQGGQKAIKEITLCGRYGSNEESVKAIAESSGLPCRPLTSDRQLGELAGESSIWQINEAIGAVATACANPIETVLVPPDFLASRERRQFIKRAALVGGIALASMGLIQSANMMQENNLNRHLRNLNQQIATIENSESYRNYQMLQAIIRQKKAQIEESKNHNKAYVHLLLKELSLTIPDNITLTAINFNDDNVVSILTIDGYVRIHDFSPEILLAEYVDILEKSPLIGKVEVVTHSKRQDPTATNLLFQLRMDTQV